jgi:uncharacterized protein (UPF0332 family)
MAAESLAASKALLGGGMYRSGVSRAYYAAYSRATAMLLDRGVSVLGMGRTNPTHAQVPLMLRSGLDPTRYGVGARRDLSRRLRNLRRWREMADYEPGTVVGRDLALLSVREASTVLTALEA